MWPIIGHKKVVQFLENQIKNNTISQTYLFIGPPSLGKFTTACFFAQMLLCQEENSCGHCQSCQSFLNNLHPDFILIKKEAAQLSIEVAREIKRQISLLPLVSKKKVIVFEEASYLTTEAQNALLKTLEEPPKYVTLILVAQKENLLPTILSRSTRLYFQPIPLDEIKKELIKRGTGEKEAAFLAHISLGQIGQVLANSLFKTRWEENLKDLLVLSNLSLKEKMEYAKTLNIEDLPFWVSIFRDVLLFKISPRLLSNYPLVYSDKLSKLTKILSLEQIHFLLKKLQETQELLLTSVNQRLLLENLILKL